MKATIEIVEKELSKSGIKLSGCNSGLPKMVYNLINKSLHFGVSEIEKSNFGKKVKQVALGIYANDVRKSEICSTTLKNILR